MRAQGAHISDITDTSKTWIKLLKAAPRRRRAAACCPLPGAAPGARRGSPRLGVLQAVRGPRGRVRRAVRPTEQLLGRL